VKASLPRGNIEKKASWKERGRMGIFNLKGKKGGKRRNLVGKPPEAKVY